MFLPNLNVPMKEGTDLQRIPFGSTFALTSLPAGKYFLEVTLRARGTKETASQRIDFRVAVAIERQRRVMWKPGPTAQVHDRMRSISTGAQ